jgi:hypothetical protein
LPRYPDEDPSAYLTHSTWSIATPGRGGIEHVGRGGQILPTISTTGAAASPAAAVRWGILRVPYPGISTIRSPSAGFLASGRGVILTLSRSWLIFHLLGGLCIAAS